jgi:hypothetical protein
MAGEIINRLNVGHVVNVKLTDSAVTNGQNLVDAYNYAKTLTPNGAALSATNRVSVIIQPGNYTLAAQLTVDTQFVDLIGLGAVKLRRGAVPAVIISGNNLNVTANDVRIKGISLGSQLIVINSNLPLQIFEDCVGGSNSFNTLTISGTFINCNGGTGSFGSGSFITFNAAGTFINCSVNGLAFGSGSSGSSATGLFINCTSGTGAGFGGNNGNTASGTFIDCEGGSNSFGGTVFSASTASGTFTNCIGGSNSFGGGSNGVASGKFYQCRLTSGTFKTVTSGGLMRNCIDGNDNIVDQ